MTLETAIDRNRKRVQDRTVARKRIIDAFAAEHCRNVQEAETLGLKYAAELRESMGRAS